MSALFVRDLSVTLGGTAATEDDEIVGVGDDMGSECFTAAADAPVLQEPVHVDVGEQRARDTALRRATRVALAPTHAPRSIRVPLFDRCLQPHLEEAQHFSVDHAPGHRLQKVRVRNRVEVFGEIGVDDLPDKVKGYLDNRVIVTADAPSK